MLHVTTRGDISTMLHILKALMLSFKMVRKLFSKNPLIGAFSVVKVEIFREITRPFKKYKFPNGTFLTICVFYVSKSNFSSNSKKSPKNIVFQKFIFKKNFLRQINFVRISPIFRQFLPKKIYFLNGKLNSLFKQFIYSRFFL